MENLEEDLRIILSLEKAIRDLIIEINKRQEYRGEVTSYERGLREYIKSLRIKLNS